MFFSWFFRLIKGAVIGTGFIIPGVSGGVLAAIFGIYEPMISFLGNITKDFSKNVRFFLPIAIGGFLSIVLVSRVLGGFFKVAEVHLTWFFIGCVCGTLPLLYKKAGEQGRNSRHLLISIISCVSMFTFLLFIQEILEKVRIPTESIWVWLFAGVLMAMGAIVPGLSPSNFLLYMGIYGCLMEGMGKVDLRILLPVFIGAVACVLLLSKIFDGLFKRAYGGMYHFILGVILASTIMIIPWEGKGLENGVIVEYNMSLGMICVFTVIFGVLLGYGMGLLEKKVDKLEING